jgi:hypothetical protein
MFVHVISSSLVPSPSRRRNQTDLRRAASSVRGTHKGEIDGRDRRRITLDEDREASAAAAATIMTVSVPG